MKLKVSHVDPILLNRRILFPDGDSVYFSEDLEQVIQDFKHVEFIDTITDEVVQYNKFASPRLKQKQTINDVKLEWNIPTIYKNLDVLEEILNMYPELKNNAHKLKRVLEEYVVYEKHGLIDMLRVSFYIVNKLQTENIVWGIGRGSCTASYILFLIGLHDVDSFKYDLEFSDFIKD